MQSEIVNFFSPNILLHKFVIYWMLRGWCIWDFV